MFNPSDFERILRIYITSKYFHQITCHHFIIFERNKNDEISVVRRHLINLMCCVCVLDTHTRTSRLTNWILYALGGFVSCKKSTGHSSPPVGTGFRVQLFSSIKWPLLSSFYKSLSHEILIHDFEEGHIDNKKTFRFAISYCMTEQYQTDIWVHSWWINMKILEAIWWDGNSGVDNYVSNHTNLSNLLIYVVDSNENRA